MPELPEVETIVRTLAPHVEGRRIVELRFFTARVHRGTAPAVAGRLVRRVLRRGKQILFELDEGWLVIRLGMTGALLRGGVPGPYTRAVLTLEDGWFRFDDVRQFGSVRWMRIPPDNLGPDPLEIGAEEFWGLVAGRRKRIKALLLDQSFVRGLGNIYADEALYRAGIHPRAVRLGRDRARRLHRSIVEVLTEAIANRGSSVSDYVDGEGQPGEFQELHQVYRKHGRPCPKCGSTIRRTVVAQRGTHYCPRCQRV